MRVEEQFDVALAIDRVYRELNDVGMIGYCVAGVKEVRVLDENRSQWNIEQRFGAIARTFDLQAEITERKPSEHIAFVARGQDVDVNGHVHLQAIPADQTRCTVVIDIQAIGALAPLLEIFAKGPQRQLINKTVTNLKTRLESVAEGGPTIADAGSHASRRSVRNWLLRRYRRWF